MKDNKDAVVQLRFRVKNGKFISVVDMNTTTEEAINEKK